MIRVVLVFLLVGMPVYVIIGMQMVFFEAIVHVRSVVCGKHWGKRRKRSSFLGHLPGGHPYTVPWKKRNRVQSGMYNDVIPKVDA
ncbi:hypothetical protein [Brevibacillus reuszeri]|uniref:hypothetical protein n=1 Tax=Brevibacillus reuszeri TaxID=54915 RepID=UPI0028A06E89|nr:hypothetical protein [Brevibacillus reuszeri]